MLDVVACKLLSHSFTSTPHALKWFKILNENEVNSLLSITALPKVIREYQSELNN
jgi:hypothetical protein